MKKVYGLVLCGFMVLGMSLTSMAGGDETYAPAKCSKHKHACHSCQDTDREGYFRTKRLPDCAFNEASYNWDGRAWDRGGYFRDYYPHARGVR